LPISKLKVARPERKYFEDDFGADKFDVFVGNIRERVEAQVAVERAAGLYDIVARAYDGREPRSHDQTLNINRIVKPPKQPLPSSGKRKTSSPTRSTYVGA